MRRALISVREIAMLFKQEVVPYIRPDIYTIINNVGEKSNRFLTKDLADELVATSVAHDIAMHCLMYRLNYTHVRSSPKHRLFDLLDSNRLPPRYLTYLSDEEARHTCEQVCQQFRVIHFSEDMHADIMETMFDRYFFELNEKIGDFVGGRTWNVYQTTFRLGMVMITDSEEDFRITEFMRLHGHEYS